MAFATTKTTTSFANGMEVIVAVLMSIPPCVFIAIGKTYLILKDNYENDSSFFNFSLDPQHANDICVDKWAEKTCKWKKDKGNCGTNDKVKKNCQKTCGIC